MFLKSITEKRDLWKYFADTGYHLQSLEHYAKALSYFEKAVELNKNKFTLMGRAYNLIRTFHLKRALEDIQEIINENPDNMEAWNLKADLLYYSKRFEESLILNANKLNVRKKPDYFFLGLMRCQTTILNALSRIRSGHPLRDYFETIRKIAWKKNAKKLAILSPNKSIAKRKRKMAKLNDKILPLPRFLRRKLHESRKQNYSNRLTKESSNTSNLTRAMSKEFSVCNELLDTLSDDHLSEEIQMNAPPLPNYPHKPLQKKTNNIENYLCEKYLGVINNQRMFFKKMTDHKSLSSDFALNNSKVQDEIRLVLKYIYGVKGFLQTVRPAYHLKFQEGKSSEMVKKKQIAVLKHRQEQTEKHAGKILNRMYKAFQLGNSGELFKLVELMIYFSEHFQKHLFLRKEWYLKETYNMACKAFYQMFMFTKDMSDSDKINRLALVFGITTIGQFMQDPLYKQFESFTKDYKQLCDTYERLLIKATSVEEVMFYYHELSRYYIRLNNWELGKIYARKCIRLAKSEKNMLWMINAFVVMIRISIYQKNKVDAKKEMAMARKVACLMNDENVANFFENALDMLEHLQFSRMDTTKTLKKRRNLIIKLQTTPEAKIEARMYLDAHYPTKSEKRKTLIPEGRWKRVVSSLPGKFENSGITSKNIPKERKRITSFLEI